MRLVFYKGKGLISRLIRWQTRGQYSHVGVQLPDGTVMEAWHVGGVRHNAGLGTAHELGTEVDVFLVEHLTKTETGRVIDFMRTKLGHGYDFRSVARFLSRQDEREEDRDKWFCSELVAAAFEAAGVKLLTAPPSRISPEVLSWSPRLVKFETVFTTKPD